MSIDLVLLFTACLLSSVAGFSFSKKQQLPGFGDPRRLKENGPFFVVTGVMVGILTFLFFDRHFYYISPESYPRNTLYLIIYPFKLAFANEVILRLGLVTIAVRLLRQRTGGVIAVSGIATIFTMKYNRFLGIDYSYNTLYITQFVISFLVNSILGYIFITRGLIHSMALHFLFGLRLPIVLWILS